MMTCDLPLHLCNNSLALTFGGTRFAKIPILGMIKIFWGYTLEKVNNEQNLYSDLVGMAGF
jgi:hypothetical protein